MTIKSKFPNGRTMLFGDSYKRWWTQMAEHCRERMEQPESIQVSKSKWISFGGLKWCEESRFQSELDEEGEGRTAAEFQWRRPTAIELRILNKHVLKP